VIGALALVTATASAPLPPFRDAVVELLYSPPGTLAFVTSLGVIGAHALLVIALAAEVGRAAAPSGSDHLRAARGLGVVIAAVAARGALGVALVAWAIAGAERFVVAALLITGLDAIGLAVLVGGTWGFARANLPRLPRILVWLAAACALATLFGLARVVVEWYGGAAGRPLYVQAGFVPPWWIDVGATLTLGIVFVVLGRYARRARDLAIRVVTCAAAFTVAACAGIAVHDHELVAAGCMVATSVAAIPALVAVRRAIVADPVKTTADVFA
jgi:hypothetical protein